MVEEKKQEPKKQKKPRRKRSFLRIMGSIIGWLFVIGLMGVLFAGGAVAGYVTSIVEDEPVRSRALIENTMNDNAITASPTSGMARRSASCEPKRTDGR